MKLQKQIPLPKNWMDLSIGELISIAMSLGVGSFNAESDEALPWNASILAEAIYANQVKRLGNAAKYVNASTIETWLTAESNGPGPSYWLDLKQVLCPSGKAAQPNRHWEEALMQLRSNAIARKKIRNRTAVPKSAKKVLPQQPDSVQSISDKAFDEIINLEVARFASTETIVQRLWGEFERSVAFTQIKGAEELAWQLLRNVVFRVALWADILNEARAGEWASWNTLSCLRINLKRNAISSRHFEDPCERPLLNAVEQALLEINPDLEVDAVERKFLQAFFSELVANIAIYKPLIHSVFADETDAVRHIASLQFTCHHHAIKNELERPLLSDRFASGGEPFSILDMYVDLPMEPDIGEVADYEEVYGDEDTQRTAASDVFRKLLSEPWQNNPDGANFLCVRGLPGSEKSTA